MHVVQFRAGPLVQKVRVEAVRAQQGDAPLPLQPLHFGSAEFGGQFGDLLLKLLLGKQTMIAGEGVDGEIADKESRDGVETERGEKRTQPSAGDHDSPWPVRS